MKKRTIILIIVLCLFIYVLPFVGIFTFALIEDSNMKFEKVGSTYEISKGKYVIENLDSKYDEEKEIYYIFGDLKNTTDKDVNNVDVTFLVYDKDDNILGQVSGYLDILSKKKTWKFKIQYDDVDASEVDHYTLTNVYLY